MFTVLKAKRDKAPHRFDKLWVEGARYMCKTPAPNFKLLSVTSDNGIVGKQVALLERDGFKYFYTVLKRYCAPGDDHIFSPWSFDFLYHHKALTPEHPDNGE
jgi:hypothetical protein